jgi:predicted dehydrogenase
MDFNQKIPNENLNVALIGIGNIGLLFDTHKKDDTKALSHIKAIYLHKKLNLKYIVDIDDKHLKKVKEFFPTVVFLTDYKQLIKNTDIDILSIATPTVTHFKILKAFANNKNIKRFFLEKPLFATNTEYKNIPNKIKNKIVVNYLRRFDKTIQKLKTNINKENKINKITINYCKGLKNNGSHMIDLINFIFDNPKILSTKILSTSIGFSDNDKCYDIYCTIKYKDMAIPIYFIAHDHTQYNIINLNIFTNKRHIIYNSSNSVVEYHDIIKHPVFPTYKIHEQKASKVKKTKGNKGMYHAYDTIIKDIQSKKINNIPIFKDEQYNIKFLNRLLKDK